ncbi:tetratricopeptide repeat protein [Aneurinibacillus thermoaerophilus]|uniref:tetratricopeptide repeat protein n=1 Tax=Aneurinibacillus thermoaerophilus TaxID=143495 RepID=UPI002E21807D|nr:tetratricopeptide repeat protein [Aneurinibacillus thermoaerophilus]
MSQGRRKDKVILFPGLVERKIEQAREALERGQHDEALEYAQSILRFDPYHSEALQTSAEILMRIGQYDEALQYAERMWKQKRGDTIHAFRIYLAILLKMEDFAGVRELLESATEMKELAPFLSEIEALHQMLQAEKTNEEEMTDREYFTRRTVLRKTEVNPEYISRLYEKLEDGTFEEQLGAIEQLKHISSPEIVAALKEYLMLVYPDPILKTFALRALKQMGETGPVFLYKFGEKFDVLIEEVPLCDEELPAEERQVLTCLFRIAHHQAPSFLSFAFQLWLEYLFTVYPLHPQVDSPQEWAAALHYSVARLLATAQNEQEVAELYNVPSFTIRQRYQVLAEVLNLDSRCLDR